MNKQEFITWAIDNFGKNYGYSAETSTEEQVTQDMIYEIYRGLYQKYAIKDIHLVSNYCSTCYEKHPNKPFHLDNLTIFERKVDVRAEVDAAIEGIVPNSNAEVLREAYTFINLLERAAEGLERSKNLLVKKSYLEAVISLQEEDIKQVLDKYKTNFRVVDELESQRDYQLDA